MTGKKQAAADGLFTALTLVAIIPAYIYLWLFFGM